LVWVYHRSKNKRESCGRKGRAFKNCGENHPSGKERVKIQSRNIPDALGGGVPNKQLAGIKE